MVNVGDDLSRVHVVLNIAKHLCCCIGQLHDVLNRFGQFSGREVVSIIPRTGAQEVFLYAERVLLWPDQEYDKYGMRVSAMSY